MGRFRRDGAAALSGMAFDALRVLLVENPRAGEAVVTPGLDDDAFERGEAPMTKSEVRSVCLFALQNIRGQ